jgi:hypothetical protein
MAQVYSDNADVAFGISSEVAGLITSKVTITKKVEKKELRGRLGGYKAVVAYAKTYEASVEGAVTGSGGGSIPVLADAITVDLGDMVVPTFFIESVTINEANDNFKTVSLKLFGSDDITLS